MTFSRILGTALFICAPTGSLVFAQTVASEAYGYYEDALRYSQSEPAGTSRIRALGGAGVALGADPSTTYLNPAGLGMVRRNTFSFSGGLGGSNTSADFLNQTSRDFRLNANIPQLALSLGMDYGREQSLRSLGFGISMSRTSDYNSSFNYSGTNSQNSLIDYFLERNDGRTPWADLDAQSDGTVDLDGLAYYSYLMNPYLVDSTNFNSYYSFIPVRPTLQDERVISKGSTNEWNIGFGANLWDRLYFGMSLGIGVGNFSREKTYTETVTGGSDSPLDYFTLREKLSQETTGISATFGLIARPFDFLRLGASWQSPRITTIVEKYEADIYVKYNSFLFEDEGTNKILEVQEDQTAIIESEYRLLSPGKLRLGAAIFFGKKGFLTLDFEQIDYAGSELSNGNPVTDFGADNLTIKQLYKNVWNIKAGAEIRSGILRFRGGFAFYPDPFKEKTDGQSRDRLFISAGGGFMNRDYFADLTLTSRSISSFYVPYNLADGSNPTAKLSENRLDLSLTFGLFF